MTLTTLDPGTQRRVTDVPVGRTVEVPLTALDNHTR